MSTENILNLIDTLKEKNLLKTVLDESIRNKGTATGTGKLLVPKSRHYSWNKVLDIFGIGRENLITVPVKDDYRMDISALKKNNK